MIGSFDGVGTEVRRGNVSKPNFTLLCHRTERNLAQRLVRRVRNIRSHDTLEDKPRCVQEALQENVYPSRSI